MTDAVPSSAAEPAGLVFPDLVPTTALALSAMDQLVEAARRSVLERVTGANGKIDAALLEQPRPHALLAVRARAVLDDDRLDPVEAQ